MPISSSGWTRRGALVAGAALALMAGAGRGAANAADRATALVSALMDEVTTLIQSGRSEAQLYPEFERILARHGDMGVVAASALGPPWRAASQAQKAAFAAAFRSYIARKYGRQFREFQGVGLEVLRVRDAGNAGVLVETRVARPGRTPVAVGWQVSERSGAPKVVNIIVEGVSLLANERAEIGALLEAGRGDLDGLIAALRGRG